MDTQQTAVAGFKPKAGVAKYQQMAEKMGITLGEAVPAVGKPWRSHQEFLDMDHAACQKVQPPRISYRDNMEAEEQRRRKVYMDANGGTDLGYDPTPQCDGMMVIDEDELRGNAPILAPVCDGCGFSIGVKRESYDPHYLARTRVARSGLPEQFLGRRMDPSPGQDDARSLARSWMEEWDVPHEDGGHQRIPAPAFFGEPGRGKSHLLSSVAETLIKKHQADVQYWAFAALLAKVKEGFNDAAPPNVKNGAQAAWDRAKGCELLVLDDIGAERPSEWAQEQFQTLVDHRYNAALPIIVASNIRPAAWAEVFGERTASRLRGMCLPVQMKGKDLRLRAEDTE